MYYTVKFSFCRVSRKTSVYDYFHTSLTSFYEIIRECKERVPHFFDLRSVYVRSDSDFSFKRIFKASS